MNPSDQEYNDIMRQTPEKPRCKVCDNEFADRDPKIKTVLLLNYDAKDNAPIYGEFYICRGCIYRISATIDVMLQD